MDLSIVYFQWGFPEDALILIWWPHAKESRQNGML
jgi:hypothetical protein